MRCHYKHIFLCSNFFEPVRCMKIGKWQKRFRVKRSELSSANWNQVSILRDPNGSGPFSKRSEIRVFRQNGPHIPALANRPQFEAEQVWVVGVCIGEFPSGECIGHLATAQTRLCI